MLKIYERTNKNNKLGMVKINNMIPVVENSFKPLDINSQELRYREILYKQLEFLKKSANMDLLKLKAEKLYKMVVEKNHKFYSSISCNFKALEEASKNFTPK